MGRFIDPTTDFGFKRLFGQKESQEILKAFLYDVLALPHPIAEIYYLNQEQLPTTPDQRIGIYDVYCVDNTGQRFLVEMQRGAQTFFKDRVLYDSTFPIIHQVEKGSEYKFNLNPIYCLAILQFRLDDQPRYLRRVQLMETDVCQVFYEKLTYVFLELPKFHLESSQLTSPADKWLYLLKHLPTLNEVPPPLDTPVFHQAFQIANEAALSPTELLRYEASLKVARDNYVVLEGARDEGRAEGRAEAQASMVRTMGAKGMDPAGIAALTDLSEDEVRQILGRSLDK